MGKQQSGKEFSPSFLFWTLLLRSQRPVARDSRPKWIGAYYNRQDGISHHLGEFDSQPSSNNQWNSFKTNRPSSTPLQFCRPCPFFPFRKTSVPITARRRQILPSGLSLLDALFAKSMARDWRQGNSSFKKRSPLANNPRPLFNTKKYEKETLLSPPKKISPLAKRQRRAFWGIPSFACRRSL